MAYDVYIAYEPFARNSRTHSSSLSSLSLWLCSTVYCALFIGCHGNVSCIYTCKYGERTRNNVRNGARKILWPFFIWCLCTLDSLGSLSRYRCLSAVHTNECACISYILSEPFRMELCGALFGAIMTVNDNIGDSFRNNGFRLWIICEYEKWIQFGSVLFCWVLPGYTVCAAVVVLCFFSFFFIIITLPLLLRSIAIHFSHLPCIICFK